MLELTSARWRSIALLFVLLSWARPVAADVVPDSHAPRRIAFEAYSTTGVTMHMAFDTTVPTFARRARERERFDFFDLAFDHGDRRTFRLQSVPEVRLGLGLRGLLQLGGLTEAILWIEGGPMFREIAVTGSADRISDAVGTSDEAWAIGFGSALRVTVPNGRVRVDVGYHGDLIRRNYTLRTDDRAYRAMSRYLYGALSTEVSLVVDRRERVALGLRTRVSGQLLAAELTLAYRFARPPRGSSTRHDPPAIEGATGEPAP